MVRDALEARRPRAEESSENLAARVGESTSSVFTGSPSGYSTDSRSSAYARSLARMYACLAGGGELDGVRLLSRKTLRRAARRQKRADGLAVIPFDMRWRLGYHGVFTTQGSPRNAFGHFGFGGSGGWADPSRELSVALIVNSGLGTPFGDMRIARISAEALTAADARLRARRKPATRESASKAVVEPLKRRRPRKSPVAPAPI